MCRLTISALLAVTWAWVALGQVSPSPQDVQRPTTQEIEDRRIFYEYIPIAGELPSQDVRDAVERVLAAEEQGDFDYGRPVPHAAPQWRDELLQRVIEGQNHPIVQYIWFHQLANELILTDIQVDALNELSRVEEIQIPSLVDTFPESKYRAFVAELEARLARERDESDKAVEAILSPQQLKRLRQIAFQACLFSGFPRQAQRYVDGNPPGIAELQWASRAVQPVRDEAIQSLFGLHFRAKIDGIATVIGKRKLYEETGRLATIEGRFSSSEELNAGYDESPTDIEPQRVRR